MFYSKKQLLNVENQNTLIKNFENENNMDIILILNINTIFQKYIIALQRFYMSSTVHCPVRYGAGVLYFKYLTFELMIYFLM